MYGFSKMLRTAQGKMGHTPAHNVAERGDVAAMKAFTTAMPGAMTTVKNKHGKTALEVAIEATRGSSEIVPSSCARRRAPSSSAGSARAGLRPSERRGVRPSTRCRWRPSRVESDSTSGN